MLYKVRLEGKNAFSYIFKFLLPVLFFTAVFNMLFTHYGTTVLFTAFDMSFTLEGLFYGFCQGMMFLSVITWLSCCSSVLTSERFLSVFGRLAPNCALVFSMVLSFIPRLKKNAVEINDAGMLINDGSSKMKKSISNFSALLTMTLEESIQVSDSMKARGFGKGRTAYSKYRFSFKDGFCIAVIILLFAGVCALKITGRADFIFEPVICMKEFSPLGFIIFTALSLMPLAIDLWEDMRWLYLKQKI